MNAPAQRVEPIRATQIAEFSEFEANLAELKQRYGNVYDLSDPKIEKQARSDRLAVAKVITRLNEIHKTLKAPILEQARLLDGEKARIADELTAIRDGIAGQIKAKEDAEAARVQALLDRVEAIRRLGYIEPMASAATIRDRLEQAQGVIVDESYEHLQPEATAALGIVLGALAQAFAQADAWEAQQAELAALKAAMAAKEQAEREERIAREARESAEREARAAQERELQALRQAEQARKDAQIEQERAQKAALQAEVDARRAAEAAEIAAQAAARQAELDKAAAVEQARLDAERRQAEQEALAKAEQEKREANKRHVAKINREAAAAIAERCELTLEQAKAVVSAIVRGEIPSATITY